MATAGLRVRVCLYYSNVAVNSESKQKNSVVVSDVENGRSELVGKTAQCVTHFLNLKKRYIWHQLFFYVSFTLTVPFNKKYIQGWRNTRTLKLFVWSKFYSQSLKCFASFAIPEWIVPKNINSIFKFINFKYFLHYVSLILLSNMFMYNTLLNTRYTFFVKSQHS